MAAERLPLRLTRSLRLRDGRDFDALRTEGQRVVRGCLIANWKVLPPGARSRVGVIASRKLGSATERNQARRLLREVFRLHQHDLRQPLNLVLVARSSIVGKRFGEVERDFLTAMRQTGLVSEE